MFAIVNEIRSHRPFSLQYEFYLKRISLWPYFIIIICLIWKFSEADLVIILHSTASLSLTYPDETECPKSLWSSGIFYKQIGPMKMWQDLVAIIILNLYIFLHHMEDHNSKHDQFYVLLSCQPLHNVKYIQFVFK